MQRLSHNMIMRNIGLSRFVIRISFVLGIFCLAKSAMSDSFKTMTICQLGNGVRTLEVQKDKQGQCHTIYTKGIVEKDVGSGQYAETCVKILNNIRTNLEKADWKCKEIKEVRVSNLNSEE